MFDAYASGSNEGKKKSNIDYDALNQYVVEACKLEKREVLIGVVSSIIDLGQQEQEDAAMPFVGSEEDEADEIAKRPLTYFEDMKDPVTKKTVRMKRWPQKAIQSIAIAVDFPDIMLDKGQFFGDDNSEEKPLRLYLGGQFFIPEVGQVVGRPTPLKVTKNTKEQWSFNKKHICYKMADAAKLVDASKDEVFLPQDIDKLLGESFQFAVQVFINDKGYYTEYVNFTGALGRGQKAPNTDVKTSLIQFNQDNDLESLKELRHHVKNTIKQASNYEGSKIQKQLDELQESYKSSKAEGQVEDAQEEVKPKVEPKKAVKSARKPVPTTIDDMDDDVPF